MHKSTELFICLIMIFAVSTQGDEPWWEFRAFVESMDFQKKSCPDGFLADVDYVIITGFINVSNKGLPPIEGNISVLYFGGKRLESVPGSIIDMRTAACAQVQQLPQDSCRCLEQDGKFIRVKCNITMRKKFALKHLTLGFRSYRLYESNLTEMILHVYSDTLCGESRWSCSANQGSSLLVGSYAMSGIAIIFTALFFTVSSLISYGK